MENNATRWSSRQDGFITMNWERLTDAQMAMEIGRSEDAVTDRRVMLGHRRSCGKTGPRKEGVWSEGKMMRSAEQFVESLGEMTTNDKLWMIDLRIDEINVCLMHLFDNAPYRKAWGNPDARALEKIRAMVSDLKRVRQRVCFAGSTQNEAA